MNAIEKKRAFIINLLYYALLLAGVYIIVQYGLPMVAPFIFGLLIACLLRQPTLYLEQRLPSRIGHKLTAVLVILLFYATIGTLLSLLVVKAISAIEMMVLSFPPFYESEVAPSLITALALIESKFSELDPSLAAMIDSVSMELIQSLGDIVSDISGWVIAKVSGLATSIPNIFIRLVLMIISSFFIAMDYEEIIGFCKKQFTDKTLILCGKTQQYLVGTLLVCLRSYLIIMSLTFIELAIGLNIIGINHAILFAAIIAVFDILPVLGAGGVILPWAIITLLCGDIPTAIGLFVIYLIITVVRNIIEPKIVGGQLGLHPIVTLISMFVGLQLFGGVGLFGCPIIISLIRYLSEK